ncbi:hypothetical protein PUN28_003969 [Cardiocondyla obscurior]|uniref:Uncharacterized protein n=1 Tax=Cardiocondyla obscurior TaxID=286306 RepID=A0AAW2GP34_9HYME
MIRSASGRPRFAGNEAFICQSPARRVSRAIEIDRSPGIDGIAVVSPTWLAGKTPSTRRAHVPAQKRRTDVHGFVIHRPIDRSDRDPARRRDQTLQHPSRAGEN